MAESSFLDTDLALPEEDTLQGVIIKWGNETIQALRKSLRDRTSQGTSKKLEQSLIVLPIEMSGSRYVLTFEAEDYWKFINKGVQGVGGDNKSKGTPFKQKGGGSPFSFKAGKKPSASHFDQWSNAKGLNKYAVRESVFRQGIKATHFFDEVYPKNLIGDLVKRLEKAGTKEIEFVIGKGFKDGN